MEVRDTVIPPLVERVTSTSDLNNDVTVVSLSIHSAVIRSGHRCQNLCFQLEGT